MKSTLYKVKIVAITIQVLEYYMNVVDTAVPVGKRTDSNFERGSTVGKMLLNSVTCYREIVLENLLSANFIVILL